MAEKTDGSLLSTRNHTLKARVGSLRELVVGDVREGSKCRTFYADGTKTKALKELLAIGMVENCGLRLAMRLSAMNYSRISIFRSPVRERKFEGNKVA